MAGGIVGGLLDLRTLELTSGQALVLRMPITIDDLVIADEKYSSDPSSPEATVEVAQSASGWHTRLAIETTLRGPCWRCLADASVPATAEVRDFAAFGREARDEYDEDLDCEYLDGEILDLGAMARDAVVDVLPTTILCRDDCAGLCPTCGANLNIAECSCTVETVDPRWSGLAPLADRLRDES